MISIENDKKMIEIVYVDKSKSVFRHSQNYIFSIESDWSDDEREELEKLFGVMSEKGEEYTKLRQLRRSRQLNINKNIKCFVMK